MRAVARSSAGLQEPILKGRCIRAAGEGLLMHEVSTVRSQFRIACVVSVAGMLAAGHAVASDADADAASRCAAIGDDHQRLACYDGIFRFAGAGAAAAAAVPAEQAPASAGTAAVATVSAPPPAAAASSAAPAPAPAAAPASPVEDYGLTPARKESIEAAQARASGAPAAAKQPVAAESMTAKISTVARRLSGELVLILDNGQVWVQIDTETKARVKEGDEVTIRKASLGSYFLVAPNHILVRVRRVK